MDECLPAFHFSSASSRLSIASFHRLKVFIAFCAPRARLREGESTLRNESGVDGMNKGGGGGGDTLSSLSLPRADRHVFHVFQITRATRARREVE